MAYLMSSSTERKVIRWVHLIFSIPIIGFIYGPVASIPEAVTVIRWVLLPAIILSGLWLWKGHRLKKIFRR
jgi:thiosulfate reductase cytochrome b subunit